MQNYIRLDPKSNKPFYYIQRKEFNKITLASLPLNYDNISLYAAQHDNIGTVMLTHNYTPVLFQGISINDLIKKASQEELCTKNYQEHLTSEFIIIKTSTHVSSVLQNYTHYVYSDLSPKSGLEQYMSDKEGKTIDMPVLDLMKSIFYTKPDECILNHHNEKNIFTIYEGEFEYHEMSFSSDYYRKIYTSQFYGLQKPYQDKEEKEQMYRIRFRISDEQYKVALEEIHTIHNKCVKNGIHYNAIPQGTQNVENCFSYVDGITAHMGIHASFLQFFLDYQILHNVTSQLSQETLTGQYMYNTKYETYPALTTIWPFILKGITHLTVLFINNHMLSYTYDTPLFKYAGKVAFSAYLLEWSLGSLVDEWNSLMKPTEDSYCDDTPDSYFMIMPCTNKVQSNMLLNIDPFTCTRNNDLCILDRGTLYDNVHINDKGNFERIHTKSICKDENCTIVTIVTCYIEYDISAVGQVTSLPNFEQ